MIDLIVDFLLVFVGYGFISLSIHHWLTRAKPTDSPDTQRAQAPSASKPEPQIQPSIAPTQSEKSSEALSAQCNASKTCGAHVPEDSNLKRHFISLIGSMLEALYHNQQPSDSTLTRHFQQWLEYQRDLCIQDQNAYEQLLGDYSACRSETCRGSIHSSPEHSVMQDVGEGMVATWLPSDSTLKRHYVANIRRIIEESYGQTPTAFDLARHYKQLIEQQLEECLSNQDTLERLTEN
jgi:hypothetical protein